MRHDKRFRRVLAALPLGLLLAACSGQTVDLGGGDTAGEGGPVCDGDGIATGNYFVTEQAGLDALTGCREIRGSLRIAPFDANFTPLEELQRVEGMLELGGLWGLPSLEEDPRFDGIALGRPDQLMYGNPAELRSLEGLESLEFVEHLIIYNSSAPSLAPLARLHTVTGLGIHDSPTLRDLSGLEQLRTVRSLDLSNNPELVSLDGLVFPESWILETLSLSDLPKLSNIDALSELKNVVEWLHVEGTALENLDALSQLRAGGEAINLSSNPALIDISGLDNLEGVGVLNIVNNDALRRVPQFRALVGLETLTVFSNDALEVVDATMPLFWHNNVHPPGGLHYRREVQMIAVGENPRLVRFALSPNMQWIDRVYAYDNESLQELDLGGAVDLGMLSIKDNPRLDTIVAPDLKTVRELGVKRNPQLSMTSFGDVQTAITDARDNAP